MPLLCLLITSPIGVFLGILGRLTYDCILYVGAYLFLFLSVVIFATNIIRIFHKHSCIQYVSVLLFMSGLNVSSSSHIPLFNDIEDLPTPFIGLVLYSSLFIEITSYLIVHKMLSLLRSIISDTASIIHLIRSC